MKLLYCPHCHDVRSLRTVAQIENFHTDTKCRCGKSWGHYEDDLRAVYGGSAVMLGFANSSLIHAIHVEKTYRGRPDKGTEFTAFIIPESAPTVRREGKPIGGGSMGTT